MHVQYENITETLSIQERERKQNGIIESERRANSPFTCKMWKIVDVYTPSWRLKNHPCNKKQQSKHTGENIHPWMVRMRIVDAFVDFRCNKLRRASIYLVLSKPGKILLEPNSDEISSHQFDHCEAMNKKTAEWNEYRQPALEILSSASFKRTSSFEANILSFFFFQTIISMLSICQ